MYPITKYSTIFKGVRNRTAILFRYVATVVVQIYGQNVLIVGKSPALGNGLETFPP